MSISFSEGADQKFKVPGDGVILRKILPASTLNYLQNSPNFFPACILRAVFWYSLVPALVLSGI